MMKFKDPSKEKGQAIVEFVIVFPIQLLFTLGIMQLSLMYIAKQMTEYAAFQAARAALVVTAEMHKQAKKNYKPDPKFPNYKFPEELIDYMAERARISAAIAISPITRSRKNQNARNTFGGKPVPHLGNAQQNIVDVKIKEHKGKSVEVSVAHQFELIIPVIGVFLAYPGEGWFYLKGDPTAKKRPKGEIPRVTIYGYCKLPKPW